MAVGARGDTTLVSRTAAGAGADGSSFEPVLSGDGRLVAYISAADNLSTADDDTVSDIFVFNARTKSVELVSRRSNGGAGGDGGSSDPAITPDGRFVAFSSTADNFVTDVSSGIYVYDRKRRRLELVSRNSAGEPAEGSSFEPSISADGRFVTYYTDAENLSGADDNSAYDVYLYDRKRDRAQLISRRSRGGPIGDDDSELPRISANGRVIAFESGATNFSAADDDGEIDIFAYDRRKRRLELVSRAGRRGPGGDDSSQDGVAISASGRFVAFGSDAQNLSAADVDAATDIFARDRLRKRTALVSRESGGGPGGDLSSSDPTISASGRFVAFQSGARNFSGADEDNASDVFAYDRKRRQVRLVSRASDGGPGGDATSGNPGISGDGRFVAFSSNADNFGGTYLTTVQNIFRHDYRGR